MTLDKDQNKYIYAFINDYKLLLTRIIANKYWANTLSNFQNEIWNRPLHKDAFKLNNI